ncbi:hypothetical protein D3C71_1499640 [compost metagenome]
MLPVEVRRAHRHAGRSHAIGPAVVGLAIFTEDGDGEALEIVVVVGQAVVFEHEAFALFAPRFGQAVQVAPAAVGAAGSGMEFQAVVGQHGLGNLLASGHVAFDFRIVDPGAVSEVVHPISLANEEQRPREEGPLGRRKPRPAPSYT